MELDMAHQSRAEEAFGFPGGIQMGIIAKGSAGSGGVSQKGKTPNARRAMWKRQKKPILTPHPPAHGAEKQRKTSNISARWYNRAR